MSNTVELQILNKVIANKDISILLSNNLTQEFFLKYRQEYNFITDHMKKYHTVPDELTIVDKFNDFDLIEVNEIDEYLVEKIREQRLYREAVPIIQKSADLLLTDSNKAVDTLLREMRVKVEDCNIGMSVATDIVLHAKERLDEFNKRVEKQGLLGITTGINELDNHTHGMLGEDLITIVGRTNEGKTWLMLYLLIAAHKNGHTVLLYSGEMTRLTIGFRFDTINANINNSALMHGTKLDDHNQEEVDYSNYIHNLSNSNVPFYVVTPKDLHGKELDVLMLENLIRMYNPEVIGLDQLSLMADHRNGETRRIQLGNVTADLRKLTEVYQIPIVTPAQANREAENAKIKNPNAVPTLTQIADSDDIARNSTRVFSIGQIENTLKIKIIKNSFGRVGMETLLIWDINYGVLKPMQEAMTEAANDGTEYF